eukprot:8595399-Pyramimonas_sp.AAC.1
MRAALRRDTHIEHDWSSICVTIGGSKLRPARPTDTSVRAKGRSYPKEARMEAGLDDKDDG